MPASQHDRSQNELADRVPGATKGRICARITNTNTDTAVGGDNFEDDVEGRIAHRVLAIVGGLGNGNEKDREGNPPDVMAELRSELLVDKVAAR